MLKIVLAMLPMIGCGCSSEVSYGRSDLDQHPVDSDGDMLTDFEERLFVQTYPSNSDTDGDGLPDGWEWFSGLDPLSPEGADGPNGDPYGEGVTNLEKYRRDPDKYRNRGLFYTVPQ